RRKDVPAMSYCRNKKTGEYAWQWKDLPRPQPLYNLMGLACSPKRVLVVEGEKKADYAQNLLPDWCVITWPSGANNVQNCNWKPLTDLSCPVVLWPDKDQGGIEAMNNVINILGYERCRLI